MIDPVSTQAALRATQATPGLEGVQLAPLSDQRPDGANRTSFGEMVGDLIQSVNEKGHIAENEARRLMVGESNNLHSAMIAMQESGVAFTLLIEVRNKLVESYQELMRMPV